MADTKPTLGAGAGKDLPIDKLLAETEQERSAARDKPPASTRAARRAENRAKAETERAVAGQLAGKSVGKPAANTARGRRERRLLEQFGAIGATVTAFDQVCGPAILEGAPRLAAALARLADENPAIARALDAGLTGSAWFELTLAVGAIALPIAAHHNLLPGGAAVAGLGATLIHEHPQAEANGGA